MRDDWRGDGRMPISFRPKVSGGGGGPVLPQVASATLLLNLQADALSLNDNDPVSLWPDLSGNGHDFTQTGGARPKYVANHEGYPAVYFGSYSTPPAAYMTSPAFANHLDKFAVFGVGKFDLSVDDQPEFIGVMTLDDFGWAFSLDASIIDGSISALTLLGTINWSITMKKGPAGARYFVASGEYFDVAQGHAFVNGDNSTEGVDGTLTDWSNDGLAYLGARAFFLPDDGYTGWMRAAMIYQITDLPNWPTDRTAITAWLAAKYGITLP